MVGGSSPPTMEQGSRNLQLATDLWSVASSPPFRYSAAGSSAALTEPWENCCFAQRATSKIQCAKYMKKTASQHVHAASWNDPRQRRLRLTWAAPTAQMFHAEGTGVLAVDTAGHDARLKHTGRQHPCWPSIAPFVSWRRKRFLKASSI